MGIFLILAQVALAVLDYGAHVLSVSPWAVFLPAILFGTLWFISVVLFGKTLVIDRLSPISAAPAFPKRRS